MARRKRSLMASRASSRVIDPDLEFGRAHDSSAFQGNRRGLGSSTGTDIIASSRTRQEFGQVEYDGRFLEAELTFEEPLQVNRLIREAVLDQNERQIERIGCVQRS